MASPSISIDDEDWETFKQIIQIQAMLGQRENDRYSPVVREMILDFNDEHEELLEKWEDFAEGNSAGRAANLTTAD